MTDDQRYKFKYHSKVYKMTLQDYINWLWLYADNPEVLPQRHLFNLRKLEKGMPLTDSDVPRDNIPPPMTAEEYFYQMSKLDSRLEPRNLDTAGVQIPANYGDYAQFVNPKNLKHLNEFNHDEDLLKYQNRETLEETMPQISHGWNN
jgi:hypothetical protein